VGEGSGTKLGIGMLVGISWAGVEGAEASIGWLGGAAVLEVVELRSIGGLELEGGDEGTGDESGGVGWIGTLSEWLSLENPRRLLILSRPKPPSFLSVMGGEAGAGLAVGGSVDIGAGAATGWEGTV